MFVKVRTGPVWQFEKSLKSLGDFRRHMTNYITKLVQVIFRCVIEDILPNLFRVLHRTCSSKSSLNFHRLINFIKQIQNQNEKNTESF